MNPGEYGQREAQGEKEEDMLTQHGDLQTL